LVLVVLYACCTGGLLEAFGVGVQGGDRSVSLVFAEAALGEGGLQNGHALGDESGVPLPSVLLGERHDPSVGPSTTVSAGVVQQHQRHESVDLGIVS
jgi:hypothetical protein